jgi:aspartate kinase
MIIVKFGGSSLGTAQKVLTAVEIVRSELHRKPVVVVSAHGKTTDSLIKCAEEARDGVIAPDAVVEYHFKLAEELGVERKLIEPLLFRLEALLHGISLLRELTPRTRDSVMSFGERLSSRMFAAVLGASGISAVPVNSYDIGFLTDSNHGKAQPLLPEIEDVIARKLTRYTQTPVITGFIGKDAKGEITTIGRSGSDYTASIIGAAAGAEEIQIWTDVDGIMTADPSVEPDAEGLPELSFDEASELAYYGAEVLHPATLIPAIRKNIPVRVANTMKPSETGTVILPGSKLTKRLAKSIVYKEDVCLINLSSPRLLSVASLMASALETLATHDIRIQMAVTSEASISLITDRSYLAEELKAPIAEIEKMAGVSLEREKAIICVVGEEMRGNPVVLGRIFTSLGEGGINARMVSQSASELNIAFLIDNAQIAKAVGLIHRLVLLKDLDSRQRP